MKRPNREFPFKCVLSLVPLINFWNRASSKGQNVTAALCNTIHERLKKAPELLEPIEDLSVLDRHKELVDALMTVVFRPSTWGQDHSAALVPLHLKSFYATPSFERVLKFENWNFSGRSYFDETQIFQARVLKAYLAILKQFYGVDLSVDYPFIVTARDPDTGLDRHFKINIDPQFVEIKKIGKLKPLSEATKKRLIGSVKNPEVWIKAIPPENFEFHGFSVLRAVDVTDQEVLSSLKRDLIEKESIFSKNGFERLQERLRTFLRQPDLVFGLAAFQGEQIFILNPQYKLGKGCIFSDSHHHRKCEFEGSTFAHVVEKGEPLVIEDLQAYPNRTPLEEVFIQEGIRSILIGPLYYQDELLGTLDLKSPNPGDLNEVVAMKLWEILPLFSMAVKRGMEELNNRVQAIIKEKCTAIHPSVEWRFRNAALNFIDKAEEATTGLEPIVFRDVYPLYGVSDIRGSSDQRNAAIQTDLITHLHLAKEVILLADRRRPLPILDAIAFQIDKNIEEIEASLGSGDEVAKLDFIRYVVEPVFDHVHEFSPDVRDKIEAYRSALDPNIGSIYQKRKDFEETVNIINETISAYLDKEEEKAQSFFPHYFEKLKTDGVDHSIYIGASMVEDGKFDLLYLKNLRLWQLMVMCGIVRETELLKPHLKLPLECSHLILVQSNPLSIRFRSDERRFDVDGAYDIRHEIIKKRIDKAMIKGKPERLTQPGKIAIVYSHRREALEYGEYIDYLQASGYLTQDLENFDLEDLQGVHGLKALRVTVETERPDEVRRVSPEEIERAVSSMTPVDSV